ncbi:LytTR family DNA-binding domain-containing protein [uncultured Pontibacter sp.]|uniref:LytR/AlgR family response regulator transcription factor n=1 Tax=uncultured Pontibacter sp. TaxID=453356 RepID=UPI0026165103|nr:LytTR family DNA-binding domain-containing protein [uncultured Pontibacter sp.]
MNNSRRFLSGRGYILLIAVLVLVVVHLRSKENLPFSPSYTFPLQDFLVHFLGTLFLWEIQIWNFKHLYERKLYEEGFSLKLVWQVLAVNIAFTAFFYAVFAPSVTVWVYRVPFSGYAFLIGLLLSLLFSLLINMVFLSLQVYRYWQFKSQHVPPVSMAAPADAAQAPPEETGYSQNRVYIKTGNEELQLPYQEIAYFYSEQKVVFAMTRTGRRLITQYTLAELEGLLDPAVFFKISRQIIAHRQAIRSVRKDANYKLLVELQLEGKPVKVETVSRYKAAEFREWFKGETPQPH